MFSLARVSHNLGLCTRHTKIESFIVSKIQLSSAISHNLGLCTRHTNRVSLNRVSLNSGLCTEHKNTPVINPHWSHLPESIIIIINQSKSLKPGPHTSQIKSNLLYSR